MTSVAVPAPLTGGLRTAALPFAAGVLVVAPLAAAEGGYFPGAWGWPALAFLWVAALALLVVPRQHVMLELAAPGALLTLAALSLALAPGGLAALEGQRLLVYAAGLGALALVAARHVMAPLLGGLLAGVTLVSCYSLATRLFPDRLGSFDAVAGYRLSAPLGYWNALAIFAALGLLLALGLAVRTPTLWARSLAAAALVPLALVVYFTFSRGGWIALGIGLAAAIALDRRRVSLVTWAVPLLVWPALAIWLASSREALTTIDAPLALAVDQGGEVALVAVACILGAAVTAAALGLAETRLALSRRVVRSYSIGLGVLALAVLLGIFVRFGAPWTIADRGWDAFSAPPPAVTDLNERLFSFSGSGRVTQWESALDAWREAPVLGIGAGGYEAYWLENRELASKIRDAHSLYLEMLAELGPLGLALLLLALGVPVYPALKA
ncbi:MAG: O-antigen ligase family protein, partial [Gemmatimonadaceae bacterium]